MKRAALAIACALACGPTAPRARVVEREAPTAAPRLDGPPGVVDLHVDLPYTMHVRGTPLERAQASPARIARGGVAVVLTPLYVPRAYAMRAADARRAYDATYADVRPRLEHLGAERWLSFEGADGFADDPSGIDAWMARGACLVGLVHDHGNALGGASQDPSRQARARGLTDAGKALAAHVVARGGLLDAAHASDATFDDLAAIARASGAPLVDSHTGVRATRDTMRNVDDVHLRVVAASHGVVGISLHGGHVGRTPGEHPTLDDVAAAILHAVEVAGSESVAIGSDFDGGIDPPLEADGESVWPALRERLRARGLSERAIDAIYGGNARRVFAWARAHGCTAGAR